MRLNRRADLASNKAMFQRVLVLGINRVPRVMRIDEFVAAAFSDKDWIERQETQQKHHPGFAAHDQCSGLLS